MKNHSLSDLLLGIFLAMICAMAYFGYEKQIIRQDGEAFVHAGMAEIAPGIYTPVYRRNK